ncbi:MAG: FKBP-type peptidyl-prolyl cis-trans isomerase [Treponema sp.]|nr:FKBP-type peptidyl-prolyl cis-trans isomerase [Treponema sp.]
MKRLVIALCLLLVALAVQAKGLRDDVEFTGDKSRSSYAFGMTVGADLRQAGLEIDYNAFTEGLRAAMEGRETVMDREEALEVVQDAFESSMRRQAAELSLKEEFFLAENASQPGVIQTESGLQYVVLEEGNGPRPSASDVVRVHYEGSLTSGTVFDSSYDRGEPEDIPLDMVIPGWAEGIMLMNVGSKHRIYLPSSMAYGQRGAGQTIPPFSTLIFIVELFDIIEDSESSFLSDDPYSEY